MTRKDMEETIIEPMCDLYMPGQHLRNNAPAQRRALSHYGDALEQYDRPTLATGLGSGA